MAALVTSLLSAWLFSVFLTVIRTNPQALRVGGVSAQGVVALVAFVEALSVAGVARVTVCGQAVEASAIVRAVVALLVVPALITPFVVLSFHRGWGRVRYMACEMCGTITGGTTYCRICGHTDDPFNGKPRPSG